MKTFENSTGDRNRRAGRIHSAVARALALVAITGFTGLFVDGCSSDTVTPPAAGFEAQGLVLRVNSADTVVDSSGVHGSLSVPENASTGEISLLFITKSDAKRSVPTGTDYKLGWTVADTSIAWVESVSSWSFKVHGRKAGTTTAKLQLVNGTATAFTSSSITITVTPTAVGLHAGDTATFTFADRDTTNHKIAGSDKLKVWTVLQENLSLYGKSNVMQVQEVTYDAAGVSEQERDTLYMVTASDGSIYEYDKLRKLLGRVSGGDAFSGQLEAYWMKISNTSSASATSWQSVGLDSIYIPNVSAPGIPTTLNVLFKMSATHLGTQATSVPAGSYPTSVHTDHTLRLNVKLSSLPITVLDDSLHLNIDAAASDGVLREVFEGRMLAAKALTVNQPLPVTGFEMELKSIKRKK